MARDIRTNFESHAVNLSSREAAALRRFDEATREKEITNE
jgi:hypothetical protein